MHARYRALVFDLDGTLIDSPIDFESMRRDLELAPDQDILKAIAELPRDRRELALSIVHRYESQAVAHSTLIEGAKDFLDWAKGFDRRIAILTRNSKETASKCIEKHGLGCDVVVAREDCEPKPSPNGLLLIADRFQMLAREMVFVGDYTYDLQAGLAAGTPTALFVPAVADFETTGASLIFNSYPQLKNWLVG